MDPLELNVGVTDVHEPPCVYWEQSLGPLEEQSLLQRMVRVSV